MYNISLFSCNLTVILLILITLFDMFDSDEAFDVWDCSGTKKWSILTLLPFLI